MLQKTVEIVLWLINYYQHDFRYSSTMRGVPLELFAFDARIENG